MANIIIPIPAGTLNCTGVAPTQVRTIRATASLVTIVSAASSLVTIVTGTGSFAVTPAP
jgi:hypothetical protein